MIRFSPKNRDLMLALRAADYVGHESPMWLVPVGDGVHVDLRAMADVQLISIRLASLDAVHDTASSICLEHNGIHPLGALASSGAHDISMLFKSSSKGWTATNEYGSVTGRLIEETEPEWDAWMVPPMEEGLLIDPGLFGNDMEMILAGELPALVANSGDDKALLICTENVSLWTLAMQPVRIPKGRAMH